MNQDPALVPELLVESVAASIDFWCALCGFEVRYDRPEEGFAYVVQRGAHVMLEQVGVTDPDGYLLRFQAALG